MVRHREAIKPLLEILRAGDFSRLDDWARVTRNAMSVVSTLVYEEDDLTRWRAIEALGRLAAKEGEGNIAAVREIVRRLFWAMNEESGSVGWHSPEAIGEILANAPELLDEYGPMLACYLKNSPFERGAHWAIARLSRLRPDLFTDTAGVLAGSLDDRDPFIQAHAALALLAINNTQYFDKISQLFNNDSILSIYSADKRAIENISVRTIISMAIKGGKII